MRPSGAVTLVTSTRWATRRAKSTQATSTPTPTPMARLLVATTTATVASMTAVSLRGIRRRVRRLCQSNVVIDTKIITATRAAIGMTATRSPRPTTRTSRKTPARNVESRVRAPERTLIIVWPIIAQPPMPPKNPVTMLAMPCPHGLAGLVGVRVGDVVDQLRRHQRLHEPDERHAQGVGRDDAQRLRGAAARAGSARNGRLEGSAPSSPTFGTVNPADTVSTVSTMIDTSGAGTAFVSRGSRKMIASPAATIG